MLKPWAMCGRAVADSTVLRARGGVWHEKHRAAGVVPHTSIDTEAPWTKSGWHGWVYGWKWHLITTVAAVWIPLAAELTPANTADNGRRCVAGRAAQCGALCTWRHPLQRTGGAGSLPGGQTGVGRDAAGAYPHTDGGVEVRRIFHNLRSRAIENFNEQFKGIFDGPGQVPTKGLRNTRRWALGAVLVDQLSLWYRYEHGLDLRVGLKPFLKAA